MRASMRLIALATMASVRPGSTASVGGVPDQLSFIAEKVYQSASCDGSVVHVNYYPKDLCRMKMPSTITKESCEMSTYSFKSFQGSDTTCEGTPTSQGTVADCTEVTFQGLSGSYYGANDCDAFDSANQQFVVLANYNGADCQGGNLLEETYWPTVCHPYMSSADTTVRSARQTCESDGQSTRWLLYADDSCSGDPVNSTDAQQSMDIRSFDAAGACNAVPGGFSSKFLGCGGGGEDASGAALKGGAAVLYAVASAGVVLTMLGA